MRINTVMRLSLGTAAAVVALLAAGCYYMPGQGGGGMAKVAIGAKGVPANLSSVALVVTAPGMAPITATASTTANSMTVSVPAGPARTFTLLLNTPSATLEGVATVDLQAGQSTTVNVTPTLGATQIVIPDETNGQIVQIDDMSGTGLTTINGSSFSSTVNPTGTAIQPYAIDFDNLGKIYIANYNSSIGGLLRINDITTANTSGVVVDSTTGITTVAVDRKNGLVYYGSSSTVLNVRNTSTLASLTPLNLASESLLSTLGPTSIAADSNGLLYMVVNYIPSVVVKYDPTRPAGSRVVASASYTFTSPWGIMVKGPYVYVSDAGARKILQFDTNLNFITAFPGPSTDPFYGPETFLAVLNRKFTVIDEKSGSYDRIASFDDMAGNGWQTYGSSSTGVPAGLFNFYGIC